MRQQPPREHDHVLGASVVTRTAHPRVHTDSDGLPLVMIGERFVVGVDNLETMTNADGKAATKLELVSPWKAIRQVPWLSQDITTPDVKTPRVAFTLPLGGLISGWRLWPPHDILQATEAPGIPTDHLRLRLGNPATLEEEDL